MEIVGELSEIYGEYAVVEWKINDFLSLIAKKDYDYDSPAFSFAGSSWRLKIFSVGGTKYSTGDGKIRTVEEFISFYLVRTTSDPRIHLECTLGFKTLKGEIITENNFADTYEKEERIGFSDFLMKSELLEKKSELMPFGVLTAFCKINYPKTADIPIFEKLLHDLKTMMLNGDHSDMLVKVKGAEFQLHKSILASRNPYFDSMFKTDMKEKSSGVVTIEDCEPDTFLSFIHFIYTGKVDRLSPENVCALYKTADKYQEDQLKNECLHFMMNTLSVDSFCDYFALALRHDEKELFKKGIELFTTESKEIVRSVKWQDFLQEYPIQANELIIKTLDHHIK